MICLLILGDEPARVLVLRFAGLLIGLVNGGEAIKGQQSHGGFEMETRPGFTVGRGDEHGGDYMVGWWWFVSWKGEAEGIQEGWSVELCGGVSGWWKR